MKLRPELLLHPLIPPPLHSLSPREILGQKWWDVQRKEAYTKNSDRCWACGTHKNDKQCACHGHFAYKTYLEGHEAYLIDYKSHTIRLNEVVALCHSCHNFIHNGRLVKQYREGINSRQYVENILNHGVTILSNAGLKPTATQAIAWLTIVKGYSTDDAVRYVIKRELEEDKFDPESWSEWRIIIDKRVYHGLSEAEWLGKYA